MSCFVPFNNKNLDTCFFVFRPTVVIIDNLLQTLEHFSSCTRTRLGCVQNSIFQSIHGNTIIWYGAWVKKSSENKESLTASLLSMLREVSSMALLIEHSFFNAYSGDSKDGVSAAKFSTGDTLSMIAIKPQAADDFEDISYAVMALFKARIHKMEGITSGVCLGCPNLPRVATIFVWRSLQQCYSYLLEKNHRKIALPYLERFSLDIKYDIYKVVHVCNDTVGGLSHYQHISPKNQVLLGNGGEKNGNRQAMV